MTILTGMIIISLLLAIAGVYTTIYMQCYKELMLSKLTDDEVCPSKDEESED